MRKTGLGYLIGLMLHLAAGHAHAQENASSPLAAVNNTDLRAQFFDLDGSNRADYWVDGAYMLFPKLKVKYELHYWNTDVTGTSENGLPHCSSGTLAAGGMVWGLWPQTSSAPC